MVVVDPRTDEKTRALEAAIRVIDLIAYAFAIAGGIFALLVPPTTIQVQLSGFSWVAISWGVLLLVSGCTGFFGRMSRLWIIEVPGTVGAIAGELVYLIVLGATAWQSTTAWVALCLIAGATLALIRRYIELQIFTTDPGVKTLAERWIAARKRRTSNIAGRYR